MSLSKQKKWPNKQSGSSLIEVLVSMLIVALGSLSLVSMQMSGKKVSYDSIQRSIATNLVHDIVERMRANPNALGNYAVSNLGNGSIASEPSADCVGANCTAAELAAHDLWAWEQSLDGSQEQRVENSTTLNVGGLVNPRACITHNAGVVTVAVVWKGYQEIADTSAITSCGTGLSLYGASEKQRQIISVTTYIEDV